MFQQPTRPGWIEVISGVMFSGKSEELIRRVRRAVIARKQVQVFKSHLDARYAGLFSVSSHDGVTVEAEPVDSAEEIARRLRDTTEVVAVDEAQFLDDGIVEIANHLADRGVRVILAGTDVDFRGLPFGPMPTLMCIAEVVDDLRSVRRPGDAKPTPGERQAGVVGQSDHHGWRARVVRGEVPALSPRTEAG